MPTFDPTHYYDPDRGFRMWNYEEIVTETGTGQWVPNPNDLVVHYEQGFLIVTSVDVSTGISTLQRWEPPRSPDGDDNLDLLIGVGPGYPSESYRIFLDTSVTPHTLSPDSRLYFRGTMVHNYKVFKGSDISTETGNVISRFFDNSGNFLGSSVPVETVEIRDDQGNVVPQDTIKAPAVGFTNETLQDDERVTLVAYSDTGHAVSIAQLLVKNSAAIRRPGDGRNYIQGITLESPFLSASDPEVIEFPINMTVESLPMTGVVHYSTGAKHRIAIDGGKFALYGLENFVATVVGQEYDLVLAYLLSPDEVSYNLAPTASGKLTMPYKARAIESVGSYTVKLFMFPVWVNATVGYRIEYWLYNLDRQNFYNVTPYIELGVNSAPFDPILYGVTQTITVAVDLSKVDGTFLPYRHVQTFQIALISRGDVNNANWQIHFTPDQPTHYGRDLFADLEMVDTNNWRLRLANGLPNQAAWLNELYYAIEPLHHDPSETIAPEPTHFRVVFNHNQYEFAISQWNSTLMVNNDLQDGEVMYIEWIRRTGGQDLQMGISGLPAITRPSSP